VFFNKITTESLKSIYRSKEGTDSTQFLPFKGHNKTCPPQQQRTKVSSRLFRKSQKIKIEDRGSKKKQKYAPIFSLVFLLFVSLGSFATRGELQEHTTTRIQRSTVDERHDDAYPRVESTYDIMMRHHPTVEKCCEWSSTNGHDDEEHLTVHMGPKSQRIWHDYVHPTV
jgi:hypothetical protein